MICDLSDSCGDVCGGCVRVGCTCQCVRRDARNDGCDDARDVLRYNIIK